MLLIIRALKVISLHPKKQSTPHRLVLQQQWPYLGWVRQVSVQVLNWALSSDNSLDKKSKHGEHGQSAVLDLLDLQLSKGVWVVSQSQGVKVVTTYTIEISPILLTGSKFLF